MLRKQSCSLTRCVRSRSGGQAEFGPEADAHCRAELAARNCDFSSGPTRGAICCFNASVEASFIIASTTIAAVAIVTNNHTAIIGSFHVDRPKKNRDAVLSASLFTDYFAISCSYLGLPTTA